MKKYLSLLLAWTLIFSMVFAVNLPVSAQSPDEAPPPMPRVTKDPTDEHVKEDGYCEFVARADYCNKIIWHLVSPNGNRDVLAKNAPNEFPGLWVTGLESEKLGLDHIPRELNGWHVRAEFAGNVGNVYSLDAVIDIEIHKPEIPTIDVQPQGSALNAGEIFELQISAATDEKDGVLLYQWYRNTIDANIGGTEIPDATAAVYTPEEVPGTLYYYCIVSCTNGIDTSSVVRSECAAVTYAMPAAAETAPTFAEPAVEETTAETVGETVEETAESTLPTAAKPQVTVISRRNNALLIIVAAVILIIVILAIAAIILILKLSNQQTGTKEKPAETSVPENTEPADGWDDLSDLGDLSFYLDKDD